ncbi:TrbI/VirB10 family protein [Klebsiella aerogenes]|uniref:TrbI/VirB10 family protein n=1 Tax=Klebsiella aerogenes TaxID=548 RepID=UPI000DA262B7|nr:TrbI/VirB10 family protein [Klebsiella aerogenes]HCB2859849.1 conjugal transfer protein TraB [Klebsiella aerogenes]HCB2864852.1 conjugal transfer protein TraB [Klebsiella aerogenes]HCB2880476.1 conjugal transfer protein TraB [Klebsiella aerogenes]HCB3345915.1 conjugal transfer protein TraB [Klebsiella aerogenes]HCM1811917.1 conjugal transfer protein TraB [Klebsiella aerogenes]
MARNINILARKKQSALLVLVALGLSAIGGVAWYFGTPHRSAPAAKSSKKPVPNLAGTVNSSSFDKKVSRTAVADLQSTADETRKKLARFERRLETAESQSKALREQVAQLQDDNKLLQTELEAAGNAPDIATGPVPGGPLPVGGASAGGAVPPPTAFYPAAGIPANQTTINVNPQIHQGLSRMSVDYSDEKKKNDAPALPYIPSGSFASAMVIEGADTNASVSGEESSSPMQFRLTGKVMMPNDEVYDLTGCFVTAAGFGDISSERALVRTTNLSCKVNGHVIDQTFKGHVSFMGKNGIHAEPVIRNGKLVGYAFLGGAVDAMGSSISEVGSTAVGIGAANTISGADVARAGLGGGTASAGKTMSDYYIKRAEQFHPVIPVGAGVKVTVVFQEGFQLEYADIPKHKKTSGDVAKPASPVDGITVPRETLQNMNISDAIGSVKGRIQSSLQQGMATH